jgi:RNA polymerase sigma-70 factor (ECF subfamily)
MDKYGCLSEPELVKLSQDGDGHAFDVLIKQNYNIMIRGCRRWLNNEEDVYDAVQDAFLNAYKNIKKFNGLSKFSTWMHAILFNRAMTIRRSSKPMISLDSLADEDGDFSIEDEKESFVEKICLEEFKRYLEVEVDKLSCKTKGIVTLRFSGLRYDEIADLLKITVGAVRSRVHYARKSLRTELRKLSAA